MLASPPVMRVRTFLFITVLMLCHLNLWPQALTKQFPLTPQGEPVASGAEAAEPASAGAGSSSQDPLPDAPGYPVAEVIPSPPTGLPVRLEYDNMEKHGNVYTLTGEVRIDYRDYTLRADKIVYDQDSGNADATGHVELEGGPDDELITADHGVVNTNLDTGQFYQVVGTVGARASTNKRTLVYTTANPFIFTGRVVIKDGPLRYRVIDGTMTSCRLPRPDWRIFARVIDVQDGKARTKNGTFRLLGIPVLYLPYATHPVDTESRQSGILIPIFSNSNTEGVVIGDSFYLVINPSTDATFGTEYFSKRGWSPRGEFRYHGQGENFANFRFTALFDRGLPPDNLNQGGQDIVFNTRRDFDEHTRAVATGEYLSSYVYREAFAESFALAVASEVTSSAFITHNDNGRSESLSFDRYQNFQGITQVGDSYYTPQIRIQHVPSLDFDTVESHLQETPVVWSFDGSLSGLSRSEPGFSSGGVARLDLYPHLAMPFHLGGWGFRPEVGARDTFYTQSQTTTSATPVNDSATVNRKDLEASFELRPPVLVRDFRAPWLERFLGSDLRHTVEPFVEYRYVGGINNFSSIPRFDATDVASDTNEVDYALTQKLFIKHLHPKPCTNADLPAPLNGTIYVPSTYKECGGDTSEWISWTVGAKYFMDSTFGGAVLPNRRNVLDTTMDLTGVAFLGGPRHYSPIISRLKVRTSERMDFEWDADYDTKEGRVNASNIFADYRRNGLFGSVGYSTLQALNPTSTPGPIDQVTKYSLLRLLAGFGNPSQRGLSAAANAGYDFSEDALQYGGIQSAYNWDCCGLSIEYRRLALGEVRNENQYSFSFTLAGVGAAGNLKHSEQIF
jgi:LPS-assembly protein